MKNNKTGMVMTMIAIGFGAAMITMLNCQKTDNNPPAESEILIENFAFNPAVDTVAAGATITWINRDSAPHIVQSGTPSVPETLFVSPDLAVNDSFQYTFDTIGTFPYFCAIHTGMTGTVIVR